MLKIFDYEICLVLKTFVVNFFLSRMVPQIFFSNWDKTDLRYTKTINTLNPIVTGTKVFMTIVTKFQNKRTRGHPLSLHIKTVAAAFFELNNIVTKIMYFESYKKAPNGLQCAP